jgi:PAS domain S-box-containing protein
MSADTDNPAVTFGLWKELGELVPLSVIATDMDGLIRVWSSGAVALYGWSENETIGRPIQEITVGPVEHRVAQEIMDQVVRGEVWEGDFRARNRHGDVVDVHVVDLPIRDECGNPCGIVGLSFRLDPGRHTSSVHDLFTVAHQIRESRARERTRLARVLHDEIGQMLAGARTESLSVTAEKLGGSSERVAEYLDMAITRLRKEVAVLLEAQFDVWEMILRCYELTSDAQCRIGVLADCRIVGSVERFQAVGADASLAAFSVVRESLRNIERHAAAQLIEVSVVAEENALIVTVADDGKGIGATRPGMGLTILRDSVEQLHGQLDIRSIEATGFSGTVVSARIPIHGGG